MPRLLSINAARVTAYQMTTDGTSMTATYEVGSTDGVTFTPVTGAQSHTTASYVIGATDIKATVQGALVLAIFQQEGLALGADHVFGPDGAILS